MQIGKAAGPITVYNTSSRARLHRPTSSTVRFLTPSAWLGHAGSDLEPLPVPGSGRTGAGEGEESREQPILVVDDEPDILSSVSDVLEFEGYEVERARNGLEALEVLERTRPSLVLLDMRMPVMDGWRFARTLKERGIDVPVVVMTAAQDARKWAKEIEADGFIAKPFDLIDLITVVERFHQRN